MSLLPQFLKRWFYAPTSPAEGAARAAFSRDFPQKQIAWSVLRADEPERFVVRIFHGRMRPRECRHYAVDKRTMAAHPVEDEGRYRPKIRR